MSDCEPCRLIDQAARALSTEEHPGLPFEGLTRREQGALQRKAYTVLKAVGVLPGTDAAVEREQREIEALDTFREPMPVEDYTYPVAGQYRKTTTSTT